MNTRPCKQGDQELTRFIELLSAEDRVLIVLKKELYESRWDEMAADLNARLSGMPYIFKLINRIEDDLERIEKLQAFEVRMGIDLSDYIGMES